MKTRWLQIALCCLSLSAASAYESGCGNDGQDDSEDDCETEDSTGSNPVGPHRANLHRVVTDIQTFGAAPITFTRTLNSRTVDFNDPYWELGARQTWQHNWNYETRQLSTKTFGFFDIKVRYPNGNDYNFKAIDSTGSQLAPAADNGDRLYRWTGSTVGYTLLTNSGEELDFKRTTSPKFRLEQRRNGLGFSWTCTYDSNQRLIKITNNFGRWIQIQRETGADGVLRISAVTTSDGRTVTYTYSSWTGTGGFVLGTVVYPGQEQATYQYATADPATPTPRPLLAAASDPMYRGSGAKMKYIYKL